MKMSKLGYFSEFVLFPPLAILATVLVFHGQRPPLPSVWAIIYSAGLIAWTLIEYLLHRTVFHHAPVLSRIHGNHHEHPQELIGLGERLDRNDRGCKSGVGDAWLWPGNGGDGGPHHRLSLVCVRALRHSPLGAAPRLISPSRAPAP